jgi:hypothetical protein
LADLGKLKLFEAPDVTMEQKHQSIVTIKATIHKCATELQHFNTAAQSLQELQFSGYTSHYRSAKAIKDHSLNTGGQSNDVLAQYSQLANFLEDYFTALTPFVDDTTALNQLNGDTNQLYYRVDELGEQGNDLHTRAAAIRQLKPLTGFESIIQPTALMLDHAADGFDNLAYGYRTGNDIVITYGFHAVEGAVADYDGTVNNLPFESLQTSYIIKQVTALPVKFNDLKANVAY